MGRAHSESQMPCDEKDGIAEVERAVQVVVVQDNRGGENDPDGDDSCSRDLLLRSGRLSRDRGGQIVVGLRLLWGRGLIGWLDERPLLEIEVGRLSGGHGWGCE